MKIRPFTVLFTMLAGWVNRHQQDVIEYLKTENTILRAKLENINGSCPHLFLFIY
jgi:hypothetical protein